MRVLSIDLDFFLDRITDHGGWHYGRLPDAEYRPWTAAQVRAFMEHHCGLSSTEPTRGQIVTDHHELLFVWRDMIESGRLTSPFDFVHVDAHSDLGADGGDARYFVATQLAWLPVEERAGVNPSRVQVGNFLLFALANRWFRSFTFVLHPAYEPEIPDELLVFGPKRAEGLQVKRWTDEDWAAFLQHNTFAPFGPEPVVPFQFISSHEFVADRPFDYVFVSHSPTFTPPSSDPLMDVLAEYVGE